MSVKLHPSSFDPPCSGSLPPQVGFFSIKFLTSWYLIFIVWISLLIGLVIQNVKAVVPTTTETPSGGCGYRSHSPFETFGLPWQVHLSACYLPIAGNAPWLMISQPSGRHTWSKCVLSQATGVYQGFPTCECGLASYVGLKAGSGFWFHRGGQLQIFFHLVVLQDGSP